MQAVFVELPAFERYRETYLDDAAFRELQAENQRLKEVIEQAWDDAGLPTFLRYLREYIEQRTCDAETPGGAN